jgi:alkylation response protein AidB-like acyl-CoA dehydrogenase
MDFDFSEEQSMLRDLAREIIEAESTVDRLQEVEKSDTRFDSQLWKALADSNLLGLAVPEAQGGMDFGLI